MNKTFTTALILIISAAFIWTGVTLAAEGKATRPAEWDKIVDEAKKEGKIVIAIPPANELRKEMEIVLKQKFALEAELVSAPGPKTPAGSPRKKRPGSITLTL